MTETMNLNHRSAAIWGPAAAILIGAIIGLSSIHVAGSKSDTAFEPTEPGPAETSLQQNDSFGYTSGLAAGFSDPGGLGGNSTSRCVAVGGPAGSASPVSPNPKLA